MANPRVLVATIPRLRVQRLIRVLPPPREQRPLRSGQVRAAQILVTFRDDSGWPRQVCDGGLDLIPTEGLRGPGGQAEAGQGISVTDDFVPIYTLMGLLRRLALPDAVTIC